MSCYVSILRTKCICLVYSLALHALRITSVFRLTKYTTVHSKSQYTNQRELHTLLHTALHDTKEYTYSYTSLPLPEKKNHAHIHNIRLSLIPSEYNVDHTANIPRQTTSLLAIPRHTTSSEFNVDHTAEKHHYTVQRRTSNPFSSTASHYSIRMLYITTCTAAAHKHDIPCPTLPSIICHANPSLYTTSLYSTNKRSL